jgi:septal ring factor EnvC (AmiA/AmiB activator)
VSNWEKTMKEWDDSVPDGIKYLSAENRVLTRKVRELESENDALQARIAELESELNLLKQERDDNRGIFRL